MEWLDWHDESKPESGVPMAMVAMAAALVFFKKSLLFKCAFMLFSGLEFSFSKLSEIQEVTIPPKKNPEFVLLQADPPRHLLRFSVLFDWVF